MSEMASNDKDHPLSDEIEDVLDKIDERKDRLDQQLAEHEKRLERRLEPNPQAIPGVLNQTPLGNAERLKEKYGKDIRFCDIENSWYIWRTTHWQRDKDCG